MALSKDGHPDLVQFVDAGNLHIPSLGHPRGDGSLETYHVTDDPRKVLAVIRKRAKLMAAYGPRGRSAELGPGLYVSGRPEQWMNRAVRKWSFLETLSPKQLRTLIEALRNEIAWQGSRGHLSPYEQKYASRDLTHVQEGVLSPSTLVGLANMPYSIQFWKPDFLGPLGIPTGKQPEILTLFVRGLLAEVNRSQPDPKLLRELRRLGVVGAFTRANMSTNNEMVIWDVRAVSVGRE